MWAALFGAIVGGVLALAGSLVVAVRADRRRQIGGARLIVSQLRRSGIEIYVLTDDEPEGGWHEGPHRSILTAAWDAHAADFVGLLDGASFETVDRTHSALGQAAEFGFTQKEGIRLRAQVSDSASLLEPFTQPRWEDRWLLYL